MMKFKEDLYVIDDIYQSYLSNYWAQKTVDCIHFNHASITAPLPFIHQYAEKIQQQNLSTDSEKRLRLIERTRQKVAPLLNVKEECVAFANNTTDAASLVFWLVGLEEGDCVITTDAENESIPRIFRYYMDHANPGDGWVSWQNFAQDSNSKVGLIKKTRTGVRVKTVKAYGFNDNAFLESLIRTIDGSTKLLVFCHVLRENGRIMPVKGICEAARKVNPRIYILVDGAQCLGTIPRIDLRRLGCDFYVATPHKTLCSETVGILFMHPRNLGLSRKINDVPVERQIIKKDQFSKKLMITPNSTYAISLPEICALDSAIDYYREKGWVNGNRFFTVDCHLKMLKMALINRLSALKAQIESPISRKFTNFICSFRFRTVDNREVARQLWNKNIFVSYIYRSNLIRVSFSISNTLTEIDKFDFALRQILCTMKLENTPSQRYCRSPNRISDETQVR
jgi:selenocysteine lyase/cysteine desulfurase